MLIPLRHENMEGRRWPVVTFALIALNVLIFLGTHWKIEAQEPERVEVRTHVLVLAAMAVVCLFVSFRRIHTRLS